MQAPQLVDTEIAFADEPVTLAEIKEFSLMDADYAVNDNDLKRMTAVARGRIEAFTNVGLVKRLVTVFWDGQSLMLPLSPTRDIISVHKNDETDPLATDKYTVTIYPAKTIFVNEATCWNGQWWYSRAGYAEFTPDRNAPRDAYKVIYETGYETCPQQLKQALLVEIDALYKLKGKAAINLINPNTVLLAQPYSRNLVI